MGYAPKYHLYFISRYFKWIFYSKPSSYWGTSMYLNGNPQNPGLTAIDTVESFNPRFPRILDA